MSNVRRKSKRANFTLKINLEQEDVKKLNAVQQKIVIVKACGSGSKAFKVPWLSYCPMKSKTVNWGEKFSRGDPEEYNLSWVSFRPMAVNRVSWSTQFAVYVSDPQVQNGARIESVTQIKADDRYKKYLFTDDNVFERGEKENGTANFYYVKNSNIFGDSYTLGLAQDSCIHNKIIGIFALFKIFQINSIDFHKCNGII